MLFFVLISKITQYAYHSYSSGSSWSICLRQSLSGELGESSTTLSMFSSRLWREFLSSIERSILNIILQFSSISSLSSFYSLVTNSSTWASLLSTLAAIASRSISSSASCPASQS